MRGSSAIARLALFGLVSGFVHAGGGRSVSACSCVGFTDGEAFAASDTVFTGVLLEIQTPPGDSYSSTDPERFVFDVEEVYKGKAFARQSVVTARESGSCGLELEGSGPFVVFARVETDGIVGGAAEGEVYSAYAAGRGHCPGVLCRPGSARDALRHRSRRPPRTIRPRRMPRESFGRWRFRSSSPWACWEG